MVLPCKNLTVWTYGIGLVSSRFTPMEDQLHKGIVAYSNLAVDAGASLMQRPLKQCGLCVRSVNALKSRGITTLGDLIKHNRQQLLRIRNLGVKCADEIEEAVHRYGLQLEEL